MREFLLTIQYICIWGFFLESWIVFHTLKKPIHSYLMLSCIAALLNNIGYLLEITSVSNEAILNALKFSYLGRVFYVFFLFLFVCELVRVKVPEVLKRVLMLVHIVIYGFILTLDLHHFYYTDIKYVTTGMFSRINHGNGIVHHIFMSLQMIYIVVGLALLIHGYMREKSKKVRPRLMAVICAVLTESLFFVVQLKGVPGLTDVFDIMIIGYFFGTIFMFIAIISYDLLGTTELAKEVIADRITEAVIAVDNEGAVKYFNEPAVRLFPEIDANLDLKTLLTTDEKNEASREPKTVLERIKTAIDKNETITIDDRIYKPEKNELIHKGEIYGMLYALVDATDHYRYMSELEKQRAIADRANVAKSRFLANMSHEIRTPINAVLGMDEMILREAEDKTILSYASDIMSAGKSLLSLINDILDFSKIEEGKIQIIPVQYELSSMVNDLVNMIKDRAEKKKLELNVNVDSHIPHLLIGDEIRVRQCVLNILTNAVKYTEKGSVTLDISYKDAPATEKSGKECVILTFSVTDTGIGMRKEDMEKLFSPYERIEEKRNRTIEGTGLGMSITRQLLELMDSCLEVTTEYGKGSCFSFSVKQEVASKSEIGDYALRYKDVKDAGHHYTELFHAPEARILVVDDTEINLTVITGLLKRTQIRIDTALSGEEAIVLAAVNHYDVMLIDHMMPYMDGIETLNEIRKSGRNTSTPAVALTANAISGAREMYIAAGFTEYLSKPVDGEKLEKMLAELLPHEKMIRDGKSSEKQKAENGGSDSGDAGENALPEWIAALKCLDIDAGLANCGSSDGYVSVLRVFHQTAKPKAEEIRGFYENSNIPDYTIKVHALKSSARIIGAKELSQLAEKLEMAGKADDIAFISANTDRLLDMYDALDNELAAFDKAVSTLPTLDPAALSEAYSTILEVAQTMDYGLMDSLLKDLRGYALDEENDRMISRIEKLLTELDWDGIILAAKEVTGL